MTYKQIFFGVFVAALGGLVTWWITQRLSPAPNKAPSQTPVDVAAGAHGLGQEHAPAPAGFFVDPNTDRLVEGAQANAVTFHGSGGTVASERWRPGHKFA